MPASNGGVFRIIFYRASFKLEKNALNSDTWGFVLSDPLGEEIRIMQRKSRILILTICSNRKIKSGPQTICRPEMGISSCLPDRLKLRLAQARHHVHALITSDKVSKDGKLLRDKSFNADLVDGPDLGGNTSGGSYLPAFQRYDGRFYREFGTNLQRAEILPAMKHHMLIISGLYGLLLPGEDIQCYSCHVPDHPDIKKYWIKKTMTDLLTQLLKAYIVKCGITRVFDFMAVDSYRNLISWAEIREATNDSVLHCYSPQFAGDALLPSLGYLAKEFLTHMDEKSLLAIKHKDTFNISNDEITFLSYPIPEPPLAREIHQQQEVIYSADKIGRMRRHIVQIMKRGFPHIKYAQFGDYPNELKKSMQRKDDEIAEDLKRFNKIRNKVEYNNYAPSQKEIDDLQKVYERVIKWAKDKGLL